LQQPDASCARGYADFALAGTAGRTVGCFHLSVRLIDLRSGVLAWAEHFDVPCGVGQLGSHEKVVDRIVTSVGDLFGVVAAAVAPYLRNKGSARFTGFEAVLATLQYQCRLDSASFPQVLKAAERGVIENPDFGFGWAALAALHLDLMCGIAGGGSRDESKQAQAYIKRALKINPNCSFAHFLQGIHHLFHSHVEEAIQCADRAHELAQGMPFEVGAAGLLMSLGGDQQRGQALINQALHISPRLPGWLHWGSAISALGDGDAFRRGALGQEPQNHGLPLFLDQDQA